MSSGVIMFRGGDPDSKRNSSLCSTAVATAAVRVRYLLKSFGAVADDSALSSA